MDLIMLSLKLIVYFIILFVFIFIGINLYLDANKLMGRKKNKKEFVKVEKEKTKEKWWGGLFTKEKWEKFFKDNNRKIKEGFVNVRERTFEDNSFKPIILPNVENYDLEISIPTEQKIHPTVQGNWGFNTDEHGEGFSVGVYRDGYSADGCIFKGVSEKRYKFTLDRGPYVIRYEIRKNKNDNSDIKIFVNNKKVLFVANEGVPSGLIKYIGTNEPKLNKLTDTNGQGRRSLDYLKFIPKSNKVKSKCVKYISY